MNPPDVAPEITFRIPGNWPNPRALLERLPEGYQLVPDGLVLPDGTQIECRPVPPDKEFATIFQSACRRPPKDAELAILKQYRANVILSGPGGSMDLARTMMQAGAAIVHAGAAGVFIDNSAIAHGGGDWLASTHASDRFFTRRVQ